MPLLHPDRLFPTEPRARDIARSLYESVAKLPIISPHGHCDPAWFADNERFPDPASLFVIPDHYVIRMLVSQGISLDELGVPRANGETSGIDPRDVFRTFAKNYFLFRGTPSRLWLDHAFETVFGLDAPLSAETADHYYDHIEAALASPDYLPRALFDRFNVKVLATTESALDTLSAHKKIADSDWSGRVITTYRPDAVVDPEFEGFADNIRLLGEMTGCDVSTYEGYLAAHRQRRQFFKEHGATASDHGHPTARTEDLAPQEASHLYDKIVSGDFTPEEADCFRGQMLTEMARMSLDDRLVMQIHAGSRRNHNLPVFHSHGRDRGFDIPGRTDWVHALHPLLNAVGMEPNLTIIVFTLDETSYSRELAPLAGAYPALKLGPAWWFYDSAAGIRRYREATTETAGFYNTVGFNDDTRAFCSIPARHDVARRVDCTYLADLVMTGQLNDSEAFELAYDLSYRLAKEAYRL